MTFKPRVWFPIAAFLSAANVASVYFAAQATEPLHATAHAAFGVLFGLWAMRLRQRLRGGSTLSGEVATPALQGLEVEMDQMRQELSEAQERLDFAERMLVQRREPQP